jgi:hypothetical protein
LREAGTLDFRMDDSDGPEHIVHLDEGTVIERDGTGRRTSTAFDGSRPFQVPRRELDRLREELPQLDLQDLEARFPAGEDDVFTVTLSYGGQTVVLGDGLDAVNEGEGDEQADQFNEVVIMIDHLSAKALPASITNANREAARDAKQLQQRLNDPGRRPTCEEAQALLDKNRHLRPDLKRRIYSRVRSSQQPCP